MGWITTDRVTSWVSIQVIGIFKLIDENSAKENPSLYAFLPLRIKNGHSTNWGRGCEQLWDQNLMLSG